jgi:hypothetical protein
MNSTSRPTTTSPFPSTTENGNRQTTLPRHKWSTAPRAVTLGFWIVGVVLGIGGCILGANMPYTHPVGVTVSILWWGIFLGCFGCSIGAGVGYLFDRWWDHAATSPPRAGASND